MTSSGNLKLEARPQHLSNLASRWPFWSGAMLLSAILGSLMLLLLGTRPALYQAEGKLMVLPGSQEQSISRIGSETTGSAEHTGHYINEQIALLLSDAIWQEVLGKKSEQLAQSTMLEIVRIDDSRILSVKVRALSANEPSMLVNALMETYILRRKEIDLDQAKLATQHLLKEITNLQHSIKAREASLKQVGSMTDNEGQKQAALAANKKLLDQLLQRFREAQILQSDDMIEPAAQIVSRATPALQPVKQNVILHVILTFAISFMLLVIGRFIVSVVWEKKDQEQGQYFGPDSLPVHIEMDAGSHVRTHGEHEETFDNKADKNTQQTMSSLSSLSWELAHSGLRRVVFLSSTSSGASSTMVSLSSRFERWGRSSVIISTEINLDVSGQIRRSVGLTDLIDGCADYGDIIQLDPDSKCHHVSVGTRFLLDRDFTDRRLHTFLLALESSYDIVLIDVGGHFDNAHAMQCLAATSQTHLAILANDEVFDYEGEINTYFKTLGFAHVTIQNDHESAIETVLPSVCYGAQAAA